MSRTFSQALLVPLIALVVGCSWAVSAAAKAVKPNYDKVRNERWRCRSCPFELGSQTRSSINTTTLQTRDPNARFGRDNGLVDDDGVLDVSGTYFSRDEETGRIIGLVGSNLGLDSRRLGLTVRRLGRYALNLSLREIPRNEWLNALTAFSGDVNLRFPSVWTSAPSTQGMTELVPSSRATRIGTQRQRLNFDLALQFGSGWTLETGVEHETKQGRALSSGDFLYQATGLLTPVDYTTETLTAGLRYEGQRWLADGMLPPSLLPSAKFRPMKGVIIFMFGTKFGFLKELFLKFVIFIGFFGALTWIGRSFSRSRRILTGQKPIERGE